MRINNILIVEDEPIIADDIEATLLELDYMVAEIVDNGNDALAAVSENKIDLILMDISIKGNMDGIQLAIKINQTHKLPLIFLSSLYAQATLNSAKKATPTGYVVKPFDEGDLKANIELAQFKQTQNEFVPSTIIDKFFVRVGQELKAIEAENILYVEGVDNYSNVFTNESKHMVSHTLKKVAEKLGSHSFVRIHKSYIINFTKVTSISEGYLFINEIKLPIGRTYRPDFIKQISIL
jgi:DNA-binding LytR/AlgR family response regulator